MLQSLADMQEELNEINERYEKIVELEKSFKLLARSKPWALQKISLQGIILVKECL